MQNLKARIINVKYFNSLGMVGVRQIGAYSKSQPLFPEISTMKNYLGSKCFQKGSEV